MVKYLYNELYIHVQYCVLHWWLLHQTKTGCICHIVCFHKGLRLAATISHPFLWSLITIFLVATASSVPIHLKCDVVKPRWHVELTSYLKCVPTFPYSTAHLFISELPLIVELWCSIIILKVCSVSPVSSEKKGLNRCSILLAPCRIIKFCIKYRPFHFGYLQFGLIGKWVLELFHFCLKLNISSTVLD